MRTLLILSLLCMPLRVLHVTSPFGYRHHPLTGKYARHDGIDLRADHDTVFAVLDGCVGKVAFNPSLGIYIRLVHQSVCSIYGHLSQSLVTVGDTVTAGQPIAISGATGQVTAPHLHLAVTYQDRFINPLKFLYQMLNQKNHE